MSFAVSDMDKHQTKACQHSWENKPKRLDSNKKDHPNDEDYWNEV